MHDAARGNHRPDAALGDAHPEDYALAQVRQGAGTQFDPRCVEGFLGLIGDPRTRSILGLAERAGPVASRRVSTAR
jgi:hypothetical protein